MGIDLAKITPDTIFDGGDLDCGSGLILLIRENMMQTPVGGVLEMRSIEPTVADDLPPWCRMAGHMYLGKLAGDGHMRYFVRRGEAMTGQEEEALARDKEDARKYEWRLRARATGNQKSTIYVRNFSFDVGQAASFEEKDAHPSALEYLFGALAGSLVTGFASECVRENLEVDDIEMTVTGTLNNVLAHMGLEEGDPSVNSIEVKCFVSTFDDEEKIEAAWSRTAGRSPIVATLNKCVALTLKLAIV